MASIWQMQGVNVADGKPSNTHIQIVDAGTAGWEVVLTFRDEGKPPQSRIVVYPTYKQAKITAQFLAMSLGQIN